MANKNKKDSVEKKDTAKNTVTPAAAIVKEAVKDIVKEVPAKAEPVKEAAKKEAPKKEAPKKEAKAAPAKEKAPAAAKTTKKTAVTESSFVEFEGKQLSVSEITENAKKHWQSANSGVISDIKVYINTNQSKAFYVVNNEDRGEFEI